MKTRSAAAIAAALLAASLPDAAQAAFPYNGLRPIPTDRATMELAEKVIGKPCVFKADKVGPQIAGLSNLPNAGQGLEAEGFTFVRRNGAHRVGFLAREVKDRCTILAVHALPPAARGEEFQSCEVQNPDPMVNTPISTGLGLMQRGELVAYLEADMHAKTLTQRDPTDKRIHCYAFESGE